LPQWLSIFYHIRWRSEYGKKCLVIEAKTIGGTCVNVGHHCRMFFFFITIMRQNSG
jgi:hypothetical protein